MLAVPDCTRIVEEFDGINELQSPSTAHHEEEHSLQVKFHKDIRSFIGVVKKLDNPFLAKSQEPVALDTQLVFEQAVVTSLSEIHELGQTRHSAFVSERIANSSVPPSDTIKRNNVLTFAKRPDTKIKGNKRRWHAETEYDPGYTIFSVSPITPWSWHDIFSFWKS